MRHSLRYYRHSGPVIYKSKLTVPSVSMPCECRILQSPIKEQVKLVLLETVERSLVYSVKNLKGLSQRFATALLFVIVVWRCGGLNPGPNTAIVGFLHV